MESNVPCANLPPTKSEINWLPCVFARPLSQRVAVCEFARINAQAKTLTTRALCSQPLARAACAEFNGLLVEKSVFALRRLNTGAKRWRQPGTGAAELRQIQGGGLSGLRDTLDPAAPAPDVQRLLYAGKLRLGEFSQWPWLDIIKGMATWTARRRRR
ncbi:MAG: hypothetical protein IPH08_00450 [Rhodocyclaceae bacterium]|nr:hypothetical protein [Rhodocyclaceae bacterium]